MKVYPSAANHLSYHKYPVMCPDSAAPQHPAFLDGDQLFAPLYEPINASQPVRSMKSITEMMHLRASNVYLDIINDEDVIDICNQINAYLREVKGMPYTEEIKSFTERLLTFRGEILRIQKRVFNKHPDWARRYHSLDSGFVEMLYKYFEALGMPVNQNVPVHEAVDQVDRQQLNIGKGGSLSMPSLSERLRAAEDAQQIQDEYAANPGVAYDTGF